MFMFTIIIGGLKAFHSQLGRSEHSDLFSSVFRRKEALDFYHINMTHFRMFINIRRLKHNFMRMGGRRAKSDAGHGFDSSWRSEIKNQ